MIDTALLDAIDALPADEPAQAHVKAWAARVRLLRKRMEELGDKARALCIAGDDDACNAALAEHKAVAAELSSLNRKLEQFLSRLRPAPETTQ